MLEGESEERDRFGQTWRFFLTGWISFVESGRVASPNKLRKLVLNNPKSGARGFTKTPLYFFLLLLYLFSKSNPKRCVKYLEQRAREHTQDVTGSRWDCSHQYITIRLIHLYKSLRTKTRQLSHNCPDSDHCPENGWSPRQQSLALATGVALAAATAQAFARAWWNIKELDKGTGVAFSILDPQTCPSRV